MYLSSKILFYFFKDVYLFILRDREQGGDGGGGVGREREGVRECQAGSMLSAEPNARLSLPNPEIMA